MISPTVIVDYDNSSSWDGGTATNATSFAYVSATAAVALVIKRTETDGPDPDQEEQYPLPELEPWDYTPTARCIWRPDPQQKPVLITRVPYPLRYPVGFV